MPCGIRRNFLGEISSTLVISLTFANPASEG